MGAEEDALLRLRGVDEVGASVASSAAACRKFFFFFFHTALQFHSADLPSGGSRLFCPCCVRINFLSMRSMWHLALRKQEQTTNTRKCCLRDRIDTFSFALCYLL